MKPRIDITNNNGALNKRQDCTKGNTVLTTNVGQQGLNEWEIGEVILSKGEYNVSIHPLQMQGKEHLRLQSVQLVPAGCSLFYDLKIL